MRSSFEIYCRIVLRKASETCKPTTSLLCLEHSQQSFIGSASVDSVPIFNRLSESNCLKAFFFSREDRIYCPFQCKFFTKMLGCAEVMLTSKEESFRSLHVWYHFI